MEIAVQISLLPLIDNVCKMKIEIIKEAMIENFEKLRFCFNSVK
ncbi:hypothetical protein LEP1GSC017_0417 [Leptospira meyeri serovar Hardjo str. Went 5]|nr:hypothetical protein LEP1GSC017_0417 [Leptospira meyeri serovar Hardjo str. Went 5]